MDKSLRELHESGIVVVETNQDGSKKLTQKQYEVQIKDGEPTAVEKEPIVQPRIVKEQLLQQKALLTRQLDDINFMIEQFN